MRGDKNDMRGNRRLGDTQGASHEHLVQICTDESMVMLFYTNIICYFAGQSFVPIHYRCINFLLDKSIDLTNTIGTELREPTFIETRCFYLAIDTFNKQDWNFRRRMPRHFITTNNVEENLR